MYARVPQPTLAFFPSSHPRLSSYDTLVELGAKVGVKVRERDQQLSGTPQRAKVSPDAGAIRMKGDRTDPSVVWE